jgi:hypothetical protein
MIAVPPPSGSLRAGLSPTAVGRGDKPRDYGSIIRDDDITRRETRRRRA